MELQEATKSITSNTGISITLVIAIVSAVYMFGAQSQKLSDMQDRMERQEAYASDVATMREQVKQLGVTLGEVRTDVKDIKDKQATPIKR